MSPNWSPQHPPFELTAEPTDASASCGRDRKLAAAPLTASAFASPDVSQERPLPFVPSSGSGTTHLRWSPSGPPRDRGRDWGGAPGLQGLRLLVPTSPPAGDGVSLVCDAVSADICAHTACFCSTEHSSSFRVLLKHRGHPVTQGHRRIAGTGPPGNRKWRLSEQWTPRLTGGSQHPLWGPTSQALGTQDQADTAWDEQTRNYYSAAMPGSQLRDSQPVISRQQGTPTPLHTIDSSADSWGAGQARVGWAGLPQLPGVGQTLGQPAELSDSTAVH